MLILERRTGTSFRIGDDISVEVRQIRNRKAVKLAIRAPRETPIIREEVVKRDEPSGAPWPQKPDFRVTLVEDDPGHAKLIQFALGQSGVTHVRHHTTGNEALHQLAQSDDTRSPKPSLILLDLKLPDMSGLDILKTLRSDQTHRSTPVVMLSATQSDQQVSMCLDNGANAFVVKATEYQDLKESIARITDFWTHARFVA